ncbi:hypothetical protein D3C76_1096000 [compost metagenome]
MSIQFPVQGKVKDENAFIIQWNILPKIAEVCHYFRFAHFNNSFIQEISLMPIVALAIAKLSFSETKGCHLSRHPLGIY